MFFCLPNQLSYCSFSGPKLPFFRPLPFKTHCGVDKSLQQTIKLFYLYRKHNSLKYTCRYVVHFLFVKAFKRMSWVFNVCDRKYFLGLDVYQEDLWFRKKEGKSAKLFTVWWQLSHCSTVLHIFLMLSLLFGFWRVGSSLVKIET
jgi:hypothetical protein